ncbi:hypothetical protein AK812_SmicGene20999 [Symbiodinium microadriaticum]|uniref:Uncharacterized protein n=1 Tax=Symbiodinium microadriaticum TaxID=2951 RepID=A0A1Q9DNG4_SYMMI|nr:hypothetical protein AK812_SmicGene20999 [Symbiodinium microadriaticum]
MALNFRSWLAGVMLPQSTSMQDRAGQGQTRRSARDHNQDEDDHRQGANYRYPDAGVADIRTPMLDDGRSFSRSWTTAHLCELLCVTEEQASDLGVCSHWLQREQAIAAGTSVTQARAGCTRRKCRFRHELPSEIVQKEPRGLPLQRREQSHERPICDGKSDEEEEEEVGDPPSQTVQYQ